MIDPEKHSRAITWLTGVIAFLALLLLAQSWMVFRLWRSSPRGVAAPREEERVSWFLPFRTRDRAATARREEDRILVLQSADELEDIHAQLNSIFNELMTDFDQPAARPLSSNSRLNGPGSMMDEIRRLHLEMNSIFESAFSESAVRNLPAGFRTDWEDVGISSSMSFEDKGDHYAVRLPLPGMDRSNIVVRLENQALCVSARRSSGEQDKDGKQVSAGSFHDKSFETKIRFPAPVNAAEAQAVFQDEILRVNAPKQTGAELSARVLDVE